MVNYLSATYTYDGHGLRVKKVSGSTTTIYVFSGSKVIAEYDNGAAVGSPSREYIYSGGALLAKIDSSGTKYYHQDHLSNRLVTNSSGGTVAQVGHFPFGESWYNASNDKLIFTTYERDSESGNDYAKARYDINRLGRFSSPDPSTGSTNDPQSLNRYSYVKNDPDDLTDSDGLCPNWSGTPFVINGKVICTSASGPSQRLVLDIIDSYGYYASVGLDWEGLFSSWAFGLLGTFTDYGPADSGSGRNAIARAADAVIAILGGDNPCADFFNQASKNSVADFASTGIGTFEGPNYFQFSANKDGKITGVYFPDAYVDYRGPGGVGIIELNQNGSFFKSSAFAAKPIPGLPLPPRLPLTAGSFAGGTLEAQIADLLHEFAHIENLVPDDPITKPGQSGRNQETIEDHWRL